MLSVAFHGTAFDLAIFADSRREDGHVAPTFPLELGHLRRPGFLLLRTFLPPWLSVRSPTQKLQLNLHASWLGASPSWGDLPRSSKEEFQQQESQTPNVCRAVGTSACDQRARWPEKAGCLVFPGWYQGRAASRLAFM